MSRHIKRFFGLLIASGAMAIWATNVTSDFQIWLIAVSILLFLGAFATLIRATID